MKAERRKEAEEEAGKVGGKLRGAQKPRGRRKSSLAEGSHEAIRATTSLAPVSGDPSQGGSLTDEAGGPIEQKGVLGAGMSAT